MVQVEQTACPQPQWHFAIAVAKNSTELPISPQMPCRSAPTQSLGLFRRSEPEADIEVIGHLLDSEVDPADWLTTALSADGRQIISNKPVPLLSGAVGDVVAQWQKGTESFAGRFYATKWGPRLFVLCCRCKLADYPRLAEDFLYAITHFGVFDHTLGSLAEHARLVSGSAPVDWQIVLPQSWSVQQHPPSEQGTWFEATHTEAAPYDEQPGELDGRLMLAIMQRAVAARPRQAANILFRALRDNDIRLEHADFRAEPATDWCEQSWLLVTEVQRAEQRGELRCRVMMPAGTWVVAGVLGPQKDDDEQAWMRNKRVLDVATWTLEISAP